MRDMAYGHLNRWVRETGANVILRKIDSPNMGAAIVDTEFTCSILVWAEKLGAPVKIRALRMTNLSDWRRGAAHRLSTDVAELLEQIRLAALKDCEERSWWCTEEGPCPPKKEGAQPDLRRWHHARYRGVDEHLNHPKYGKAPYTNLKAADTVIRVRRT